MSTGLKITLAGAVLSAGLSFPAGLALAAEQLSSQQIIDALKPPRLTRSLTTTPSGSVRAPEDARFVDSLRNRTSRSLSTDEREKIAAIAKTRPSIDLEITFDYNSATIGSKAMPQITALGDALNSAELKGATFVVAGHTDAKGSDGYNQGLSERRADAVKRFLKDRYGIESTNLVTAGYGESQLKNAANPFAGENRRVQVINMAR
jgi:outer membrane protein OmpA-like peptidoglycan-associated protein